MHHGRTPPCADALPGRGRRVVVRSRTPIGEFGGAGVTHLRAHGVRVDVGGGRHGSRRPDAVPRAPPAGRATTVVKLATSLDGRSAAADGSSQWITGPTARARVHRWRAESQAVLVGSGTALATVPRSRPRRRPTTRASAAPCAARRGCIAGRGPPVRHRAGADAGAHHGRLVRRLDRGLARCRGQVQTLPRRRRARGWTSPPRSRTRGAGRGAGTRGAGSDAGRRCSSRSGWSTACSSTSAPRCLAPTAVPRSPTAGCARSTTPAVEAPRDRGAGKRRPARLRARRRRRSPRGNLMFTGIVEELGTVAAVVPVAAVPASRSRPPRC